MSVSANFHSIVKKYGNTTVIDQLNLDITKSEFFTLLGPSGCGKTTLLRMVAGFNTIEGGDIIIGGNSIGLTPAHKRNMGMVFQNYAIFPHLSVFDNVAYGLKARKLSKEEIKRKVDAILETMQIQHLHDRFPKNMSGGQQQRVALARAIVIEPTMLLMDEPLSNLDAKLRIDMRLAIKKIQRDIGITTIYVTHDQEEALAISDRIAVMDKGIIQQVGTPQYIYQRPANIFVASFIGHSNILEGTREGNTITTLDGYSFTVNNLVNTNNAKEVQVGVRPEEFILKPATEKGIKGTISLVTFLGRYVQYQVQLSNKQWIEYTQELNENTTLLKTDDDITLQFNTARINIYDKADDTTLIKRETSE